MRDRRLCEEHGRANVDVKHGLQVGKRQVRGHAGGSDARAVDEDIKSSKCVDRLANRATDSVRVGAVGLNGSPRRLFLDR